MPGITTAERASLRRARCALAGALAAAGCVVVDEQPVATTPPAVGPVTIPFAAADSPARPHDLYYRSVVSQLQQAWVDDDRQRLAALLDTHDRADAPAWAQDSLTGFRRVLRAMQFEAAIADRGTLHAPTPMPAIGEPLALAIRLGPLPTFAVRLLGGDDPARARFVVVLRIADTDLFGARAEWATTAVVDLPRTVDFAAGELVEVPLTVEVPAGASILRQVELAAFLMPGHVEIDGLNLPNRRVRCAAGELELVPRGHDRIADRPLAALRAALQLGDAAHFPHVLLAARALADPGAAAAERAAAVRALIDRVRLGRPDQVRNAIAALGLLEPQAAESCRDRTQWLQWWGQRGGG